MKKNNKKRVLRQTLFFVGEGQSEKAFIEHLRALYSIPELKVSSKSAGGKGPSNVISETISVLSNTGCDRAAALLDLDIAWPIALVKSATSKGITLIGVNPCFEAFLLDILNHKRPTPCNNQTCKKIVHPMLAGRETEKKSYEILFTKEVLDEARRRVEQLDMIIKVITNFK